MKNTVRYLERTNNTHTHIIIRGDSTHLDLYMLTDKLHTVLAVAVRLRPHNGRHHIDRPAARFAVAGAVDAAKVGRTGRWRSDGAARLQRMAGAETEPDAVVAHLGQGRRFGAAGRRLDGRCAGGHRLVVVLGGIVGSGSRRVIGVEGLRDGGGGGGVVDVESYCVGRVGGKGHNNVLQLTTFW